MKDREMGGRLRSKLLVLRQTSHSDALRLPVVVLFITKCAVTFAGLFVAACIKKNKCYPDNLHMKTWSQTEAAPVGDIDS